MNRGTSKPPTELDVGREVGVAEEMEKLTAGPNEKYL